MASPHPQLREVKVLRGNPGKTALPPESPILPVEHIPPAPDWLDDLGRREWERAAGLLIRLRVLSETDLIPLAAYCMSVSTWRRVLARLIEAGCEGDVEPVIRTPQTHGGERISVNPLIVAEREASRAMLRHACEFGFTPVSRARVAAAATGKATKFSALVRDDERSASRARRDRLHRASDGAERDREGEAVSPG